MAKIKTHDGEMIKAKVGDYVECRIPNEAYPENPLIIDEIITGVTEKTLTYECQKTNNILYLEPEYCTLIERPPWQGLPEPLHVDD